MGSFLLTKGWNPKNKKKKTVKNSYGGMRTLETVVKDKQDRRANESGGGDCKSGVEINSHKTSSGYG